MAIIFPTAEQGNERFPLPPDYAELTDEGKRLARVNAVSIGGRPEWEVAGWDFFRHEYLAPEESGFYKDGFVESPASHGDWVKDWYTYNRLIMACPRGTCKTTINLEDILRNVITRPNWECVLFLSTREFCGERLERMMEQVENNAHLIDDFGYLKPKRGSGVWNRGSAFATTIRSKVMAKPISGASLGTRPSGLIVVDDVEQGKDLTISPADLRQNFHNFFFNALLPMARNPASRIPMRVVGTLYKRTMFIYYLYKTKDPKVAKYFKRTLMSIYDMDWDAMGEDWIREERESLGAAAFSAQCLNEPTTEDEKLFRVHQELNTYHVEDAGAEGLVNPLNNTDAKLVTHQLAGYRIMSAADGSQINVPNVRKIVRPFSQAVNSMCRFITVDYADTVTEMSDWSAIQVLGLENNKDHANTLYSLDAWIGKEDRNTLVKIMAEMAIKWQVQFLGLEAYPLQMDAFDRFYSELEPELAAKCAHVGMDRMPAVLPLKFPHQVSKAEKIKGLAWRFEQFKIKIPADRPDDRAYKALWEQIDLATGDLGLLQNDDILDTLAMHQAAMKMMGPVLQEIKASTEYDPVEEINKGRTTDPITGQSLIAQAAMSGNLTEELVERFYKSVELQNMGGTDYVWTEALVG